MLYLCIYYISDNFFVGGNLRYDTDFISFGGMDPGFSESTVGNHIGYYHEKIKGVALMAKIGFVFNN